MPREEPRKIRHSTDLCWHCNAPIRRSGQKFCTTCGAQLDKHLEHRLDTIETLRSRLHKRRTLKSVHEGYFQLGLLLRAQRFELSGSRLNPACPAR